MVGTHTESESHSWERAIPDHPDHPARTDSAEYVKSRARLHKLTAAAHNVASLYSCGAAIQDHHGGGLWLWTGDDPDNGEPFMVRNLAGLEWSAQWVAITDAAGVENWVDSICNASVPLPAESHTGTLDGSGHSAAPSGRPVV